MSDLAATKRPSVMEIRHQFEEKIRTQNELKSKSPAEKPSKKSRHKKSIHKNPLKVKTESADSSYTVVEESKSATEIIKEFEEKIEDADHDEVNLEHNAWDGKKERSDNAEKISEETEFEEGSESGSENSDEEEEGENEEKLNIDQAIEDYDNLAKVDNSFPELEHNLHPGVQANTGTAGNAEDQANNEDSQDSKTEGIVGGVEIEKKIEDYDRLASEDHSFPDLEHNPHAGVVYANSDAVPAAEGQAAHDRQVNEKEGIVGGEDVDQKIEDYDKLAAANHSFPELQHNPHPGVHANSNTAEDQTTSNNQGSQDSKAEGIIGGVDVDKKVEDYDKLAAADHSSPDFEHNPHPGVYANSNTVPVAEDQATRDSQISEKEGVVGGLDVDKKIDDYDKLAKADSSFPELQHNLHTGSHANASTDVAAGDQTTHNDQDSNKTEITGEGVNVEKANEDSDKVAASNNFASGIEHNSHKGSRANSTTVHDSGHNTEHNQNSEDNAKGEETVKNHHEITTDINNLKHVDKSDEQTNDNHASNTNDNSSTNTTNNTKSGVTVQESINRFEEIAANSQVHTENEHKSTENNTKEHQKADHSYSTDNQNRNQGSLHSESNIGKKFQSEKLETTGNQATIQPTTHNTQSVPSSLPQIPKESNPNSISVQGQPNPHDTQATTNPHLDTSFRSNEGTIDYSMNDVSLSLASDNSRPLLTHVDPRAHAYLNIEDAQKQPTKDSLSNRQQEKRGCCACFFDIFSGSKKI